MRGDWVHGIIDVELSHCPSEEFEEHGSDCSNEECGPTLDIMAARAYTDISADKPIHTRNQIKNFSLTLPKTNKAIKNAWNTTRQHSIHRYFLRYNIQLNTHLILRKTHINEDIAYKYQHNP